MHNKAALSRRDLLKKGSTGLAALAIGPSLLAISQPLAAAPSPILANCRPRCQRHSPACGFFLPSDCRRRTAGATQFLEPYPLSLAQLPRRWRHLRHPGWRLGVCVQQRNHQPVGRRRESVYADGSINDAYRILGGTNINCAGGRPRSDLAVL